MITIKQIRSNVLKNLGVDLPWHQVRKHLKETKKLSYKKGSTRRIDLDRNRLSYLRILYSIRLAKQLKEQILLINIDEVSFAPEVLNSRSWLKKGINWELFSLKYSGSVSMILAVTSDGDYLAAILKSRWNSEAFIEFLKMINWWIDAYSINGDRRALVLLDNCSIHRSNKTIEYMKSTKLWYMFLPHYTPSLAPVELVFANLKRRISSIDTNHITNWRSKEGKDILKKCLIEIEPQEIIKWWAHSINVSSQYIDIFKHHILTMNKI